MTTSRTSRRTFLGLAAGSALGAFGLSACGTSGPAQPGEPPAAVHPRVVVRLGTPRCGR